MNASTAKTVPVRAEWLGALAPLTATAQREVFDPALGVRVTAGVFARSEVAIGRIVTGPCVIVEDETTIIVPAGCAATCRSDGCIEVFKQSTDAVEARLADMIEA